MNELPPLAPPSTLDPAGLRSAWQPLRDEGLRAFDAARRLGVVEAQLVASARGGAGPVRACRLAPASWADFLRQMPLLGPLKTITRNPHAVLEIEGSYGQVEFFGAMGQSVAEVDLRIFVQRWRHGFLVDEDSRRGPRQSLQFFDAHGVAIHKAYAVERTDRAALASLVEAHADPDPGSPLQLDPPAPPEPPRPDEQVDASALRAAWRALSDTHQFHGMLRSHRVQRTQALRLAGPDLALQVDTGALDRALRAAAARALPIMIFVGNPGVIQIHTGPVRRVVDTEGWLNVLDPAVNLHVRRDGVAQAWVVRKPTSCGVITSLEVYDAEGQQVALLVGKRKGDRPEDPDWRALVEGLAP